MDFVLKMSKNHFIFTQKLMIIMIYDIFISRPALWSYIFHIWNFNSITFNINKKFTASVFLNPLELWQVEKLETDLQSIFGTWKQDWT